MVIESQSIYQVGGSLHNDCPSYVTRQADTDLYQALKRGDFCYVLNSRQMGKSSLLVRTRHRLQAEGMRCVTLDMTVIGSEDITPMQWYKGIFVELWRGFGLLKYMPFKVWWQEQGELSFVQKLNQFLVEVLLPNFPDKNFCIFIDEIDSILSLPFSVNDWFAFIRFCYNQRATDAEYKRLNFAIFGVANPSDLISDRTRTPFNIGTAIELSGFTLEETKPLQKGLNISNFTTEILMQEILNWTGGQPFLTHKLCNIIINTYIYANTINNQNIKSEQNFIEQVVIKHIINNWEQQDEPEHLRTIRNRIISNSKTSSRLLGIYQKILLETQIKFDSSPEETEVLLSGLIAKSGNILKIKNPIYQHIFNLEWTQTQLNLIRPYSQNFEAWIASEKTDDSRLLRGQALLEARTWALGKSLSDGDHQFLAASEKCDRAAVQQALEAEKLIEVEARLLQEYKNSKLQRRLLTTVALSFFAALGLASIAYTQYRNASNSYEITKIREIQALISATEGQFLSNQNLNALVNAVRAKIRLKNIKNIDNNLQKQVDKMLIQSIYGMNEYNRFRNNKARVWDMDFTQDGKKIAIISQDNQIIIWNQQGKLLSNRQNYSHELRTLAFFPDEYLATGDSSGKVQIWTPEGNLFSSFSAYDQEIFSIVVAPDGKTLVTAGSEGSLKLWHRDGTLLNQFVGHNNSVRHIDFSPDGKLIASASIDGTAKLWKIGGELVNSFEHSQAIYTLAFSPDSQYLVTGGNDRKLKLWSINEGYAMVIGHHDSSINTVAFSPDGNMIASGSWDKTIRLWSLDGRHIKTFASHTAPITTLSFSPDGETLASGDFEGEVKLWKPKSPFLTLLSGHEMEVRGVIFSPDSQQIFSSSWAGNVYYWDIKGSLLGTFDGHKGAVIGLAISPDGEIIATGSWDESIRLWNRETEVLKVIDNAHVMGVNQLAFSPNGEVIASVGNDNKVKLWSRVGEFLREWEYAESITGIAFSPDGKMVATGSEDKQVRLLPIDGSPGRLIGNHQGSIWAIAFSPQGDMIASGSSDNTVKLWFLDGRDPIVLDHHQGIVDRVAFSPDGNMIASASWDGTIQLWTNEGVKLKTLIQHEGSVRTVAFSDDGKWIASGGDDQNVIIWNLAEILNLDELSYACSLIENYLDNTVELNNQERNLCH